MDSDLEGPQDGWDNLASIFLADPDVPEESICTAVSSSGTSQKPGKARGRPRGSSLVQSVLGKNQVAPVTGPAKGSIEYARRFRRKPTTHSESQSSVATPDALARFGPVSQMPFVGTDVQKRFRNALCHALEKQIDYQDESISVQFDGMHASASAQAKFVGCSRQTLQTNLLRTGSAVVHGGGWLGGAFLCCVESMIDRGLWRPVLLCRRLRYDETPTKVRLAANVKNQEKGDVGNVGPADSTAVSEHAKILQTEFVLFILVEDRQTSSYLLLSANIPTSLQAMERSTGVVTFACLQHTLSRVPELRRISKKFRVCVHHSCTDKYGSNLLAEKALKCAEPHYVKYHLPCQVHCLATSMSAMNSLVTEHTAGILSVSLAAREVGSAGRMRAMLQKIFLDELEIRPTTSSEESEKYRKEVYDEFLPLLGAAEGTHDKNAKRRMVLSHFLNSDIQQRSIQHMCPFQHCQDEAETRSGFASFLCRALVPCKPPKYSRGRWTGFEGATQWCGVLAAHHSLLERLMVLLKGKSKTMTAPIADKTDAPIADSKVGDDGWDALVSQLIVAPPVEESNPLPEAEAGQDPDAPEAPRSGFDWVEYNRQKKAEAAGWAANNPYPSLSVMQQVTKHLQRLMYHYLKISGESWQKEKEAAIDCDYTVLNCARGESVKLCFDSLLGCLETAPKALPSENHTRRFRVLYFCMICKAMCAVHQLLRCPQSGLPFSIFKALEHGWSEFNQVPPCMHDELSAKFAEIIQEDKGDTKDASAILHALAIATCVDVAAIECKHATNRDFSLLRGSGWTPSLQVISAKFACGTFKFRNTTKEKKERKVRKVRQVNKRGKVIRRPGGAWRAYMSFKCKGKKFTPQTVSQIAKEFRALTGLDKAHFQEIGELATIAGQHGHVPFGPPTRTKSLSQQSALHPQPFLQPGDVTESGAIVTANGDETVEDMVPFSGKSFAESFSEFAKQLRSNKRAVAKKEASTAVDCATASASDPSPHSSADKDIDSLVKVSGCSGFRSCFQTEGVSGLHHVHWAPPVQEIAQAGDSRRFEEKPLLMFSCFLLCHHMCWLPKSVTNFKVDLCHKCRVPPSRALANIQLWIRTKVIRFALSKALPHPYALNDPGVYHAHCDIHAYLLYIYIYEIY